MPLRLPEAQVANQNIHTPRSSDPHGAEGPLACPMVFNQSQIKYNKITKKTCVPSHSTEAIGEPRIRGMSGESAANPRTSWKMRSSSNIEGAKYHKSKLVLQGRAPSSPIVMMSAGLRGSNPCGSFAQNEAISNTSSIFSRSRTKKKTGPRSCEGDDGYEQFWREISECKPVTSHCISLNNQFSFI
jgi:hypothetical protein